MLTQYEDDARFAQGLAIGEVPGPHRAALRFVRNSFPEAILAGGSLRDWLLGRPIKDYDFFVDASKHSPEEVATIMAEIADRIVDAPGGLRAHCYHVHRFERPVDYDLLFAGVREVWDLAPGVGGISHLQVIVVDFAEGFSLQQVAMRADFGICRIAWDGTTLLVTPDFMADMQGREFTLRTGTHAEGHFKRWSRLQQRYPGWALTTPSNSALYSLIRREYSFQLLDDETLANRGRPVLFAEGRWLSAPDADPFSVRSL